MYPDDAKMTQQSYYESFEEYDLNNDDEELTVKLTPVLRRLESSSADDADADDDDDYDEEEFITEDIDRESFSDKVEKVVIGSNGSISFIEATIYTAEYFKIDLCDISSFITKEVKRRIEAEAIENKMLSVDFMKKTEEDSLSDFF